MNEDKKLSKSIDGFLDHAEKHGLLNEEQIQAEKRNIYTQVCSRCRGTGVDPDDETRVCDCCKDGIEELRLTDEEAQNGCWGFCRLKIK